MKGEMRIGIDYSFNPTLVRLRRPTLYTYAFRLSSFNPTLVRLRPDRKPSYRCAVWWFQSHAGSIEARERGEKDVITLRVSIPRWFD